MYFHFVTALLAATALGFGSGDYDYKNLGDDWPTKNDGKYALCGTGL